jgi:hypothetical protein
VDISQSPALLRDKRGIIDGRLFFSRSPFRSPHFLAASAMNLACIVAELILVFGHTGRVSPSTELTFVGVGALLTLSWFGTLRHIRRVRAIYQEGLVKEPEAGSPLDVALGVAASAIFDWLACISAVTLFSLIYIGTHFACLNGR